MIYDHFIGNTNCIHTIVFNVEDSPEVQLNQLRYWFHFLQSRIPPVEPLGNIKFQLLLELLSCLESETKLKLSFQNSELIQTLLVLWLSYNISAKKEDYLLKLFIQIYNQGGQGSSWVGSVSGSKTSKNKVDPRVDEIGSTLQGRKNGSIFRGGEIFAKLQNYSYT